MLGIATPNVLSLSTDEFCPSCGEFKPLIEETGFCLLCTRQLNPDLVLCASCGLEFKPDGQHREVCWRCRISASREKIADEIENLMALGLSYEEARTKVTRASRPICLSCGNRINGGTRGRHFFCRRSQKCKKAARRYKWYKEYHNMSKPQAIAKVLETLTGGK